MKTTKKVIETVYDDGSTEKTTQLTHLIEGNVFVDVRDGCVVVSIGDDSYYFDNSTGENIVLKNNEDI